MKEIFALENIQFQDSFVDFAILHFPKKKLKTLLDIDNEDVQKRNSNIKKTQEEFLNKNKML